MPIAHTDLTRIFGQYLEGTITKEAAIASAVFYPRADRIWLESEIAKIEQEEIASRDECIDESVDMLEDMAANFEKTGGDYEGTMLQAAAVAYAAVVLANRWPKASGTLANTSIELAHVAGSPVRDLQ